MFKLCVMAAVSSRRSSAKGSPAVAREFARLAEELAKHDEAGRESRRERGLRQLAETVGLDGAQVLTKLIAFSPELTRFIVDFAYGDVIERKQLDARTLKDGTGLVDNYTFYLVRRPWAIANPGISKSVVDEIHAVGEWENENPAQAARQLAPAIGLPEDITLTMLERRKFGVTPITPAVIAAQQKIADTFYAYKLIPKSLDIRSATLPSGN